ncbi:hypothetical protein Tco_0061778 [Tanacetum coccineum]
MFYAGSAVSVHVVGPSEVQKKPVYPTQRSRVVPISLFQAINDCQVDMESFLKNIGFGSLYGINIGDLQGRLNHFVVKSFDCNSFCMKLNHGSIKVDSKRVHDMLGIPVGGTLLLSLEETEGDPLTYWLAQFGDLDPKKIRATHIAEQIRVREDTPCSRVENIATPINGLKWNAFSNTLENIKGNMSIFCFILCQCVGNEHKEVHFTHEINVGHFYNLFSNTCCTDFLRIQITKLSQPINRSPSVSSNDKSRVPPTGIPSIS